MSNARGRIVKILDGTPSRWVVNLGAEHLAIGDELVVFELGEEIVDPESGDSLGALELVKCHATADHVQDKLSILSRKGPEEAPAKPRVLSAVLADTRTHKQTAGRPKTTTVSVGDAVRKV